MRCTEGDLNAEGGAESAWRHLPTYLVCCVRARGGGCDVKRIGVQSDEDLTCILVLLPLEC